jgi:hypothetical protein
VYTSSILVVASTPNQLILQIYFVRRRFRPGSMIPARKWLPASWRILKKSVRWSGGRHRYPTLFLAVSRLTANGFCREGDLAAK